MNATERANYDRAERLVHNEVYVCLSALVSTLAASNDAGDAARSPLGELIDQAQELCSPLLDYEEAARYAGWTEGDEHSAIEFCNDHGVEPYEREIFEHWSISQSLADDLAELGERIDTDFAGMCVWGRTTTGQGIAMDSIIADVLALHDRRLASIKSA